MRLFRWCRQELAEGCKKQDWHVHVCITSPKYRNILPGCGRPSLRLSFHDLDPAQILSSRRAGDDMAKAQELVDGCMNLGQAEEIVLFLEKHPEGDVIVNCEAGVSRSPGVVLALRTKFGGDVEAVYKSSCPNIYVANILGKVLGLGQFQKPAPSKEIVGLFTEVDES